jgi:hypothetical protein
MFTAFLVDYDKARMIHLILGFFFWFLLLKRLILKLLTAFGCMTFQVGAVLVFRVLGCKLKRITLTNKKTLLCSMF